MVNNVSTSLVFAWLTALVAGAGALGLIASAWVTHKRLTIVVSIAAGALPFATWLVYMATWDAGYSVITVLIVAVYIGTVSTSLKPKTQRDNDAKNVILGWLVLIAALAVAHAVMLGRG